jgi:hypothetical protein
MARPKERRGRSRDEKGLQWVLALADEVIE